MKIVSTPKHIQPFEAAEIARHNLSGDQFFLQARQVQELVRPSHRWLRGVMSQTASLVVALAAGFITGSLLAQDLQPADQRALLNEDWAAVNAGCDRALQLRPSPICRLLKGHACLALNRNNDSLVQFASADGIGALQAWETWSSSLTHEHPDRAIAWYLEGDAHARLGEWGKAEQCFSKAVVVDEGCYLAWNARGIVAHATGNSLLARTYFLKASKIKQDFADAYLNRGTLNIYLNAVRAAPGAAVEESFRKAEPLSTDKAPGLATVGLGCLYYARGDHSLAAKCFTSVPSNSCLALLARQNACANAVAVLAGLALKADKLGISLMTIESNPNGQGNRPANAVSDGSVGGSTEDGSWRVDPKTGYIIVVVPRQGGGKKVIVIDPKTGRPVADPEGVDKEKGKPGDKPKPKPGEKPGATPEDKPGEAQEGQAQSTYPPVGRPGDVVPPDGGMLGAGGIRRPLPGYPPMDVNELERLIRNAETAAVAWGKQISLPNLQAAVSAPSLGPSVAPVTGSPGGVDGDVRGVRANRGQWTVVDVYGLLYPVDNPPQSR